MSQNEPLLASRRLAPGDGYRVARLLQVYGGLHYIAGNSTPYFSLTGHVHRLGFPNQCESGGAYHELILKRFPRFTDLAALHLSDIDGVPMHGHGLGNAWYWLAGALTRGAGERYHGGNGTPARSSATCLELFARHLRISPEEAARIHQRVAFAQDMARADIARAKAMPIGKEVLAEEIQAMLPRWKAEAEACIARHGLVVFGDAWGSIAAGAGGPQQVQS